MLEYDTAVKMNQLEKWFSVQVTSPTMGHFAMSRDIEVNVSTKQPVIEKEAPYKNLSGHKYQQDRMKNSELEPWAKRWNPRIETERF